MHWTRDRTIAAVILVASFIIFRLSPMHPIADSRYQMMFSQHLLWNHSFSLDASAFRIKWDRPMEAYKRGFDYPYQLERRGDRFYCWYPPGSTILSMPYIAVANARGISATQPNGAHNQRGDSKIQADLAALLMAGLTVITYFTARLFLSSEWSLVIAAATAFGTTVWSVASRSMWIHTWGIFVLAIVVWLIARAEIRQRSLYPVALATCLSWLYFIRPSFAVSIIAVSIYVLIRHRAALLPLVVTGGLWLAAFFGYSYYHFGTLLPDYYKSQSYLINVKPWFWTGLAGILVSPARGLFVYCPIMFFLGYLLVRYRKQLRPGLTWLALGNVCGHIAFMAAYAGWYGGHCFGPRYCTDVIPWFALLGILAVDARLRWAASNSSANSLGRTRVEWSFGLLLLAVSVLMNGIGATSFNAWYWNMTPTNVDQDHSRLWDWKNPPFLQMLKPRFDR